MQSQEDTSQVTAAVTGPPRPAPSNPHSPLMIWSATQRRSVLLLAATLLILLAIESLRRPATIADPLPKTSNRSELIQDRLDPNTAGASAMAAIPELGEKRAAEIVDYREKFHLRYAGQRAFNTPEDLMRIKGIGLATVANLRPYLMFPQDRGGGATSSEFSPN